MSTHDFDLDAPDARALWEGMYAAAGGRWSGRPNDALVRAVQDLAPGTALDLGCGEGGDVVWLASRGWRATGADVSPTALARGAARAAAAGLADRARFEEHDLGASLPAGAFDLVAASFLHSFAHLDRDDVLRRAAGLVAPGGSLVVVGHVTVPPWGGAAHAERHVDLPAPAEVREVLAPATAGWQVLREELLQREVEGPDGQRAAVADGVLHLRRPA
ncbi:class I SAM-dependent methyltransferase [Kineococcus indalonis]|uniref:class I SAM-dependent methyltransferase n=1 Tax=Kineococcus indalonis TaxID=2696566 RepID=UPI002B1BDD21|nr:class I SAM-dependent methyltransferase [Kineococcus indalonis]